MGYFASIIEGGITIPADKKHAVLDRAKAINGDPDKFGLHKSGRGSGRVWFAWMPEDFSGYTTLEQLLDDLFEGGYEKGHLDDPESLTINSYDNKISSQMDLALAMLDDVGLPDSRMVWCGEEGELWAWIIHDGQARQYDARVIVEFPGAPE